MDKNTEFKWNDKLVQDYIQFYAASYAASVAYFNSDETLEKFKQSKSKKEEPQWEILEIESYGGLSYPLIDGEYRLYTDGVGFTATYLLQRSDSKIKTVKRLSDNTVWSVGQLTEHGKISAFRIGGGIMTADITDSKYPLTFLYLSQLQAPKEEQVPHRCKYCNALVTSDSDEGCYANPNRINEDIGSEEKQEEQVPIKVEIMEFGYGKPQENKGKFYVANFNLPNNAKLPTEKYQSIKSAIEDVISGKTEYGLLVATGNIESYNKGYSMGYKDANKYNDKKYTESELLLSRREGFDAGRAKYPTAGFKYDTFEDYINSLK